MENGNFLEKLSSQFGQNASVKNVFGEAVHAGNKTIIPVAQIAYGLGGGFGKGRKDKPGSSTDAAPEPGATGEGGGGGGGMRATPKGVYEITDTATRFIPANNPTALLIGIAIGFFLRSWMKRR